MNANEIKEDLRRKREARIAAQAAASGERPPAGQERQRPAPLTAEEARQFGIVEERIPQEEAPPPMRDRRGAETAAERAMNNGAIFRPGVSSEFLTRNCIRHVDEEQAEALIGFRASGIWIRYPGLNSCEMTVNDRPFGRLRLDHPLNGNKYLSPRGSGAQLYIPQGPPFGKEIVICEGEFKALALCEANIRAVGIGGIQSAMTEGKAIPDLRFILRKYNPSTIYFLGDSDTSMIFDFSREAVKLAKALPEGCTLRLPRIPLSSPKGIDDIREALGEEFPNFWREITDKAVEVGAKLSPDALAVDLVSRELPAIKDHPERAEMIVRLTELASYLDPLHLEMLANAAGEHLGVSVTAFRETAKQIAARRKENHAEKSREAKAEAARIVNDPRPKIELPGANRLLSTFGEELAPLIAPYGFFVKNQVVVTPNESGNGLEPVTGRAFRTSIERHVVPYHAVAGRRGATISFDRTLSKEDAESMLVCPQFIEKLPRITATNNARFSVMRSDGGIALLREGYDRDTGILTLAGGPVVEDWELPVAASALRTLFEEFCFREDDRERSLSVALAAMLTLFNLHVLPKGTQRPGFLYSANSEGSGKSLLAKLAMIPRLGNAPTGCDPEDEQEIRKSILAAAIAASPVMFLDNVKKHLSSGSLEACMTACTIKGRFLGQSREIEVENSMTIFLTGNGCTISPDLRRRLLIVELFLREARPEDRTILHPLDDAAILRLRGDILSALWSITRAWSEAGRPKPSKSHPSFPAWSAIIGGILEHAGFASPCTQATASISGDRDTEDMQRLVAAMAERHGKQDLKFNRIVELCRELRAFSRLVGEQEEDLDRAKRNLLSRIFTKFDGRIFPSSVTFRISGSTKNTKAFYVEN